MKIAYIAHPISGDVAGNLKRIEAIGRQINLEEPETVPFANYFFDCYALRDDIPAERARGIKNNNALMRKGFIDELRLYGNTISPGMIHEIKLALQLDIPIRSMTLETAKEFVKHCYLSLTDAQCIEHLKARGYRIEKPVTTYEYI
ncbi:MAG: hypothetical protein RBR40_08395 [Tenuifilaceae bacterium]|nr:hypothetical protein [Tenuifilaceae bacterium]